MRVGVASPYWETMGGGERYIFTVAEFFLRRGDRVDIFAAGKANASEVRDRFGVDVSRARFAPDVFFGKGDFLQRLVTTEKHDLMFFLSDGSIPATLARSNILHFQTPLKSGRQKTAKNWIKLARFQKIVCNSFFTKRYIDESYGVNSSVVYPPVDVVSLRAGRKEKIILSVGRFFSPSHPKKQEVMVDTFLGMVKGGFSGWRLVLIGGVTGQSDGSVDELRRKTRGAAVEIITDAGFDLLKRYYAKAMVYWHAAGFGEDLTEYPERAEHFGMTTVEAMAAGAVPIVFAGGGQMEIVTDGVTGYLWRSKAELVKLTTKVAENDKLRSQLAGKATVKAREFSKQNFFQRWSGEEFRRFYQ